MNTENKIAIPPKEQHQNQVIKDSEQANIYSEPENTLNSNDLQVEVTHQKGLYHNRNIFFLLLILIGLIVVVIFLLIEKRESPLCSLNSTDIKNEDKTQPKIIQNQLSESETGFQKDSKSDISKKQLKDTVINEPKDKQDMPKYIPTLLPITDKIVVINSRDHVPTSEHSEHESITFPYPTLGMPQIGKTFNRTVVPLGKQYYTYEALMDEIFKPYNNTDCEYQRYGDSADGGYVICKNFLKHSDALINFGVQGRDLFGCGLTTDFLIPNFQYDCTNSLAPVCLTNSNGNYFQSICLGERTELNFYSLKDVVDLRNLTKRHVTMKIDVEGAEWPGFRSFPIEYLDYVDQFVLQIHLSSGSIHYPSIWGNIDTLKSIGDKFISTNLHMNNYACVNGAQVTQKSRFYPSFAIEVTLVNKKLITVHQNTRSYNLNYKNTPNKDGYDCQLHDQ